MDIPVYLIAGMLDSGKTNFINGILQDGFAKDDKTLLICCEEGDEEYNTKYLYNVFTYKIENPEDMTPELFKKLEKQYKPKQVIIEYNGMWMIEPLYRTGLPANWILYQIMVMVDAPSFESYVKNMGQIMMEKITNADMIIFNRCTPELRASLRSRNLRMVNRRADIYLENEENIRKHFAEVSEKAWNDILAANTENKLEKVFPTPDFNKYMLEDMQGKIVVLDNVRYPENQFMGSTGEYVWSGTRSDGMYFVRIDGRQWLGLTKR